MKKLILFVALITSVNLHAAITLVSDLDDTIKITNAGDPVESARRGLFSHDVFLGMPQFLKSVRSYVDEIHVLSASPTILKLKIEDTFKRKGIKVDSIILKNPLSRRSKFDFKVNAIKTLMEKNSSDDFIFIGDDVDQDPEAFAEIKKLYPNRVIGSYIHVVKNRDIPQGFVKYWTSFDLYLREFQAGRMINSEVAEMGDMLFRELRLNQIIPDFADCPKNPGVWLWQIGTRFARDGAALMAKLNLYCTARQSTIH